MNVGVVDERISRNRYGSEESLLAAESGALKVVACFSGATNDLCQSTFALGTQERLNFLDGQTHDFFMANGKSTRFIAYPPKPAIVLPNPAQFVLPAAAVGLPVAAWPRELETPDAPETLCPPHASCVTASVYPKVESNEANEGIGSDLGYAIVAGGTVTIEAGTTQTGGNEDNGSSESGSGSSDQNTAPAPTSPSSGLQQHVWLAALSNPGHRFDFPWLVAQGQPPEEQPTESPQPSDEENNENSNTQTPEPMDLQGNVYYYDGDVTIYSNAAPVNGTIVATGDIIVEPFATGSGAALCPGDEPLVGQTVVVAQTLLQFGQLAIPWATSAAALAATVSTAAAGTAATAGAGAVAAAPASAAQILEFALQTLDLAQSGTVALNQLCGLARSAVSTATGLLPGSSAESAEETDSQEEANSQNDSQGSTGSDPSADSTTDSPEQSASQNDTQESGAGGLLPNNNPQESFALNLIAGGNIELHRDLLGTMIAKGDITIGPEVMQIAYPSLPEEAPRFA